MKIVITIPARYRSTRFPGKVLSLINGKPMIEWVYNAAKKTKGNHKVIILTEDQIVQKVAKEFGAQTILTSKRPKTGTDRICEVLKKIDADVIVNLQGDEPLMKPQMIDQLINPFLNNNNIQITTLAKKITNPKEITDPNVVKVVFDSNKNALYFSRSTIPYKRNQVKLDYFKHIGIYAYKKEVLEKFSNLKKSFLEQSESLEQLRLLENGYKITVIQTQYETISVDVPEDIQKIESFLETNKQNIDRREN